MENCNSAQFLNIKSYIMRYLSAILLIVLLAVAPSCKFLKSKGIFGKKDNTLEALRAQQDSIRVADSLRKAQEAILALENAKQDSIRMEEEAKQADAKKSKYNIIVGSFITPEYAKSFADEFINQGYDTKILKMEGSNFELVSAESHQSISKAISRLKEFHDTVSFDAWIYTLQ